MSLYGASCQVVNLPSFDLLAQHKLLCAGGCLVMHGVNIATPSPPLTGSSGPLHKPQIGILPDPYPNAV